MDPVETRTFATHVDALLVDVFERTNDFTHLDSAQWETVHISLTRSGFGINELAPAHSRDPRRTPPRRYSRIPSTVHAAASHHIDTYGIELPGMTSPRRGSHDASNQPHGVERTVHDFPAPAPLKVSTHQAGTAIEAHAVNRLVKKKSHFFFLTPPEAPTPIRWESGCKPVSNARVLDQRTL